MSRPGRQVSNKYQTKEQGVLQEGAANENIELKQDLIDIKDSLVEIKLNISELKNNESKAALMAEVGQLKKILAQKDKQISLLEEKINEMEQYQKKNNLIISTKAGTELKLHSYRHAVTARPTDSEGKSDEDGEEDEIPLPLQEETIMKNNFINFASVKLKVSVKEKDIVAIHKLQKRRDGVEPVLVKFTTSTMKRCIMSQRKELKGTKIYLNDHLTKANVEIEKKARKLRIKGSLNSTWTQNGRIFIKETEHSHKREIKHLDDLDQYGPVD